MEDKEKVLLKNTGILALGTLCSKIFTFFLLPLYTNVLSTADYGIVDVLQTISSFAMPFITFQLSSGMFRERKSNINRCSCRNSKYLYFCYWCFYNKYFFRYRILWFVCFVFLDYGIVGNCSEHHSWIWE